MENPNPKNTKCPVCGTEGLPVKDNNLVYYHLTVDRKGVPLTHKWSLKTRRMFSPQIEEEDTIW
jgi:hypothetical protein